MLVGGFLVVMYSEASFWRLLVKICFYFSLRLEITHYSHLSSGSPIVALVFSELAYQGIRIGTWARRCLERRQRTKLWLAMVVLSEDMENGLLCDCCSLG